MLIKKFAEFIMQGQKQAVFVALLCSILPFLGFVSVVIIALVTLRKGAREGLLVLLWSSLPAIAVLYTGITAPLIYGVLYGSFLVWILAIILRRLSNFTLTIEFTAFIGIIAVLLVHLYAKDISGFWENKMLTFANKIAQLAQIDLKMAEVKNTADILSKYATGLQASFILFYALIQLIIARYLQSVLYNPGGLKTELVNLRLDIASSVIFISCFVLAFLGQAIFKDITPIVAIPFLFAGVSLVHRFISKFRFSIIFLVLFYTLLIFSTVFLPVFLILLALLTTVAFLDSFIDFRTRFSF